MKGSRKIRISQCMIVKNEEKKIQRALSWGKDMIWERIVVDTGSTDRTIELAESLGAVVYHFPWIDDFAAAKNYALDQAKGEWIFFLDADEFPASDDAWKLFKALRLAEEAGADAVATGLLNLDEEGKIGSVGTQIRLFRNTPVLRYRRRIHEQLGFTDGRRMKVADASADIAILHDGYCGKAYEEKKKSGRNRWLLERELMDHPEDYEIMGYLGDDYRTCGDNEEARRWYLKSIEHMPDTLADNDQRSAATFSALISLLFSARQGQEAEDIYGRAVRLLPKEADFDYLLGCYKAAEGCWEEGARYLSQGLRKLEQHGVNNRSMLISADLETVYGDLALCFLRSGERKKAVETSVALLKVKPYDMKALYILLQSFREDAGAAAVRGDYMDGIIGFLEKLYRFSNPKDRLFVIRTAKEADWEALGQLIGERWR